MIQPIASSFATGGVSAMVSCMKRPRGRSANQRPTIAQFASGMPKKRLRNSAQMSSKAVAPMPIASERPITSSIYHPPGRERAAGYGGETAGRGQSPAG